MKVNQPIYELKQKHWCCNTNMLLLASTFKTPTYKTHSSLPIQTKAYCVVMQNSTFYRLKASTIFKYYGDQLTVQVHYCESTLCGSVCTSKLLQMQSSVENHRTPFGVVACLKFTKRVNVVGSYSMCVSQASNHAKPCKKIIGHHLALLHVLVPCLQSV